MNTYNGWTNWDTWEFNNILVNDESIYIDISQADSLNVFVTESTELVLNWYAQNNIEVSERADFSEVNFSEIFENLKEHES